MAQVKYKFDPESLEYKKIKFSFQEHVFKFVLKTFSPSVLLGLVFYFAFSYIFDTPEERSLRRENEQLSYQNEIILERTEQLELVQTELQERDDDIYRAIFGIKPVPKSIRQAGVGGSNKYAELEKFGSTAMIIKTLERIDALSKKIVVQSKSFDEVEKLVQSKQEMIASLPAIQPIPNKKLRHRPYGYGPRIDPVYKTPAFHHGMDFSAPTGTKIYATGNGEVLRADQASRGYGKHVRIKHGYGYETLYGHMSKILVQPGQKVKRGDLIGLVGNTGKSVGSHLHYEVRIDGNSVNPIYYYYDDLSATDYDQMVGLTKDMRQSLD